MLHWISEKIWEVVTFVPAIVLAEDSPNFNLFRGMFGLFLIVVIVYLVAMRPIRFIIGRSKSKESGVIKRDR
jgi:hypothetical protein